MDATIRILYAEDNPQDADQTRYYLTEETGGFSLEIADTGQQCLDRLREEEFDILLLDHHLPDMDGVDVLTSLVQEGVRVPVIMVTGIGDESLVIKALRLGAADYVPKQGGYLETLPGLIRDVVAADRGQTPRGQTGAAAARRILYVEHQPMDIELTLRHVAEAAPHYTVDVLRSCTEALARLAQPHDYDLVLLDLRMPDMSGLDFAREAKRRDDMPPFVMVTGQGDDDAAIATLRLGAADYIAKRSGYLDQLVYTIEQVVVSDRLSKANDRLQAELAERKRAESEVLRLNAELERRVADRTAELESANRELESFAYSVSHDLRAPLRALDGFSQVLLEDYAEVLDEQGRGYLERIRAADARMSTLIDALLELSRLTRGELSRERLDLTAMAREAGAALAEAEPERQVELAVADGLAAEADAELARALLANLLGNAWKFTGNHDAARIEVGAAAVDGETAFFVRDDGAGFDMAYAEKLFGAFQRLHSPGQFEGLGIGLATVQRIVRRHGGRVWAEGEVDRGATFWFTLPDVGHSE
jgi:signal transduction histidine kinase